MGSDRAWRPVANCCVELGRSTEFDDGLKTRRQDETRPEFFQASSLRLADFLASVHGFIRVRRASFCEVRHTSTPVLLGWMFSFTANAKPSKNLQLFLYTLPTRFASGCSQNHCAATVLTVVKDDHVRPRFYEKSAETVAAQWFRKTTKGNKNKSAGRREGGGKVARCAFAKSQKRSASAKGLWRVWRPGGGISQALRISPCWSVLRDLGGCFQSVRGGRRLFGSGWPLPCGMHQGEHPNGFLLDLVHQAIALVQDNFPGAGNSAGAAELGMIGQPDSCLAENLVHLDGGTRTVGRDVIEDLRTIIFCLGRPANFQDCAACAAARRAANVASTSSFERPRPARIEARPASTLRRK